MSGHCLNGRSCTFRSLSVCCCGCVVCVPPQRDEVAELRAAHDRVLERCNALFEENRALRLVASEEAVFCVEVIAEVRRARSLHPGRAHLMVALVEEVGELAKSHLENETPAQLRAEAVQVACVAARIALEGDEDFGKGPTS